MSNNMKPPREAKLQGLTPKRRFPEFRDAEKWEETQLGKEDISTFIKKRIPLDQLTLENYVSTENLLPDYAGVKTASKLPSTGSFTQFKKSDILISNIRPYLKKVWSANKSGGSSNDVIVIRAKSKVSSPFLTYLLKNDEFINYVMKEAKGVKMPRGDIASIKKYPLAFPKPLEQQRIADCLSFIDELIITQDQKLDALKVHKKGLLQQLFPAEGETTPKQRFPEFRDAGEWAEKRLADIGDVLQGFGFPMKFQGKKEGKYPFYKVSDISITLLHGSYFIGSSANYVDDEILLKLKAKTIPIGTTIFAKIGEAIRLNRRTITTRECVIDNNTAGIKAIRGKATDAFIFNLLSQIDLIDYSGGVVPSVNKTSLENINVLCPLIDEQQRIADCLSSVDDLITAQGQKIDALKVHKKGLIQQLFPAEGKTVPNLRFPEFRNAKEWEEKPLGQIVKFLDGQRKPIKQSDRAYMQGQYPYYP